MNPSLIKIIAGFSLAVSAAFATPINVAWTDWTTGNPGAGTAQGTITTTSTTLGVTYSNPQGYLFIQTGSGVDYFQNSSGAAGSPYTSSVVANIPTAAEMIGLYLAGPQTLTFSQTVANPFFSYVSLNGNGYGFNHDFEILSFGSATDPEGPNYSGYWGSGTSYKNVVDLGGGVFQYQLLGTGEPHGTIRFQGAFDTLTWQSLTNEGWNGFTVGVQGTAAEVFPTPDSSQTMMLFGFGLISLVWLKKRSAGVGR
jgi:hypothetical protein